MSEDDEVEIKRRLVGRIPYKYEELRDYSHLKPDSGFAQAGAKLDPNTGALMYDKYEDTVIQKEIIREVVVPPKPRVEVPRITPSAIKFSNDSRAMIQLKEEEDIIISPSDKLKMHSTRGTVSIINLSDNDRLWDIDVNLHDETDLAVLDFNNIISTELEPTKKISKEYKIDHYVPSINIKETISTHPEYPESVILEKDKHAHVTFNLELKNLSSISYKNVIVEKMIPDKLKNVTLTDQSIENAAVKEGHLIWRLDELMTGEVHILKYEGDLDADTKDETPMGDIIVKASARDTITNFIITSYDAMCRNMYFVEADETEDPGKWLCNFVCENTSTFEVEILRVEVKDPETEDIYLNLVKPDIPIPPNKRWESKTWLVEGKDQPTFIKTVVLNVIPGISKELNLNLTKESGLFKIASLAFKKSYDKNMAVSGRVTDITATIEIGNIGSAAMEHILVRDLIPKFMATPTSFRVERGAIDITNNVKVTVKPEDADVSDDQLLSFHISDLTHYGGALAKGERIIITYTTQLVKPTPDSKIIGKAEVDGKPQLPGPVVSGEVRGGIPIIDIKQILRRFSIGKSIQQGSQVGEYNIGILYKNRGNQPIKNLIIKDILPNNFTGSNYTIDPETIPEPNKGTILTWKINEIKVGETTTILYTIKGEGEYHPSDAQVFYNLGAESSNSN